jgi:hypothetical protein
MAALLTYYSRHNIPATSILTITRRQSQTQANKAHPRRIQAELLYEPWTPARRTIPASLLRRLRAMRRVVQ